MFKKYSYTLTLLVIAIIGLLSGCALPSANTSNNQSATTKVDRQVGEAQIIKELTMDWANALQSRDGKPRYEMMSEKAKEKFKQEQIRRSGDDWNFNIGVSSPWVVDFEISINGKTANITYMTQTSEPAYYNTKETLTFATENNKLVVDEYQTVLEDKMIEK